MVSSQLAKGLKGVVLRHIRAERAWAKDPEAYAFLLELELNLLKYEPKDLPATIRKVEPK